MEMLQAKQEQEKKRLREQMEAEAAVQRQQISGEHGKGENDGG